MLVIIEGITIDTSKIYKIGRIYFGQSNSKGSPRFDVYFLDNNTHTVHGITSFDLACKAHNTCTPTPEECLNMNQTALERITQVRDTLVMYWQKTYKPIPVIPL